MMRRIQLVPAVAAVGILTLPALVAIAWASPPSGVTPTLLARGTYDSFNVRSNPHGPVDFRAHAKGQTDVVVRRHEYQPGGHTGWHSHPGPVFVTVKTGTLTFYERGDETCTPHRVTAPNGYVDTGRGHIARNETNEPAEDVSVIIAPVGGPFRGELDAPSPHCGF